MEARVQIRIGTGLTPDPEFEAYCLIPIREISDGYLFPIANAFFFDRFSEILSSSPPALSDHVFPFLESNNSMTVRQVFWLSAVNYLTEFCSAFYLRTWTGNQHPSNK
jgi:hypothetical protein